MATSLEDLVVLVATSLSEAQRGIEEHQATEVPDAAFHTIIRDAEVTIDTTLSLSHDGANGSDASVAAGINVASVATAHLRATPVSARSRIIQGFSNSTASSMVKLSFVAAPNTAQRAALSRNEAVQLARQDERIRELIESGIPVAAQPSYDRRRREWNVVFSSPGTEVRPVVVSVGDKPQEK